MFCIMLINYTSSPINTIGPNYIDTQIANIAQLCTCAAELQHEKQLFSNLYRWYKTKLVFKHVASAREKCQDIIADSE